MVNQPNRQRGVISVLAVLFLAIFASLATAMAMVAQANLDSADTHRQASRALAAAETGMRFAQHRINDLAATLSTEKGTVDEEVADTMWADLGWRLFSEVGVEGQFLDDPTVTYDAEGAIQRVELGRIRLGDDQASPTFRVTYEQHPLDGEDYGSAYYQRPPYNVGGGDNQYTVDGEPVSADNPVASFWLRLEVAGVDGDVQRTAQMDVRIEKRVRFAMLSRNRIMLGRNVIIKGPVGSAYTDTSVLHGHPIQMRDNFHGLNPTLDGYLNDLVDYLAVNDVNGDNRIAISDTRESGALADAADLDRNGDGFVDPYDMFLLHYDANEDGTLTESEFTSGGTLVDRQLWELLNEAKYPPGTQFDWAGKLVKLPGQGWQDASADLSVVDNNDDYAKIHGSVKLKASESMWENGAADGAYQDYYKGVIEPDAFEDATTFNADESTLTQLSPDDFDVSTYRAMAVESFADQAASPTANDPAQPTGYQPPSASSMESVPYDSPYPYDYYARPVYENMVFENVKIPKGTNALFKNCKFVGVTFVETETDTTHKNFNYAGMQDATGALKYLNIEAEVNGEAVTDTKAISNNLRFHDCTFEGGVVTDVPQEFSHVRNKLQFTGETRFVVNDSPNLSAEQKALFRKSTILAPQYSVDVGTFTDPTSASEVTQLDGTIVAGVLDVRGQAEINGAIISTYEPVAGQGPLAEGGNPASFNTTLGYFESSAGDSEAELPDGGFGKIIVRYDPTRPMPDGIPGPITITGEIDTYYEGDL